MLGFVNRHQSCENLFHPFRQIVVGGIHVCKQGIAAGLRQMLDLQHGSERRFRLA
jgi:hypothetical protein